MNICVYGASSDAIDKEYIKAGELLGEELARRGHTLVFGGGTAGLMGATARGAAKMGGKIIGVAPLFFNADGILYEGCTELIRTTTMRERKQILEDLSDAFIMSPGGIGTYEEFFEILTLKQLYRHNKAIAVLNTKGYYTPLDNLLKETAKDGFMRDESLKLYEVFEGIPEILDYIEKYVPEEFDVEDMKHIGQANQK
ncbi:MAG: TIGR00730 family Rossman fold protein [Clostridia bacterium]|nr:TIGR00730 family Rossman fold protein [Clostridia bacterium]